MPVPADIDALLRAKKFDDVEARWGAHLDTNPTDLDFFLPVAQSLKNAGEKKRVASLLGHLSDALGEAGLWSARLTVLEDTIRLGATSASLPDLKATLREALEKAYPGRPSLGALAVKLGLDSAATPAAAAEASAKIRRWIPYDLGECFYMADAGAGRVTDLNLALGNVKIDFERKKGASIPVGAAAKHLVPLPPGHLLREWIESPDTVRDLADREPATLFHRLVTSFGRPLMQSEIKSALAGVLPESKWTRFWGQVQKHPQVMHAGKGKTMTFGWSDSADAASDQVRREFDEAPIARRIELAKKHARRDGVLAAHFAKALAATAEEVRDADASLAFEILLVLEKLPVASPLSWSLTDLLGDVDPSIFLAQLGDRAIRERALLGFRDARPEDWPRIYRDAFLREDDSRTLTRLADALAEGAPADWKGLLEDLLKAPRRHPARFLWFCERTVAALDGSAADATLPAKVDPSLLNQMLAGLEQDDFIPYRSRLRALFDRGGLALRIIGAFATEEQGRQLVENLPRYPGLEGFRMAVLEEAVYRRFPQLRVQGGSEPFFATAEAAEIKRREVEHLLKVELPANGQAMKEAVALGDLSENFEYKAARQKHEYLTARIAKLQEELGRVRIILATDVDTTEVRVGTRVWLRGEAEAEKVITLLGPWESRPEDWVLSYQSDLGAGLLGKRPGDEIKIGDGTWKLEKIAVWTDAG